VPHTYVRYLRARQWDLTKASSMLKGTLEWRLSYRPHALRWADVEGEAATGKLFVSPHPDREGRPVVVMRPRHENTRDRDGQLRLLVYVLETASRRADAAIAAAAAAAATTADATTTTPAPTTSAPPAPDGKMAWLVDFEKYSLANAPPLRTALATMDILQNHYPERLGTSVCWRAPSLFSMTWRVVGPLVDPVTRSKIAFVEKEEGIEAHFDRRKVESCVGGLLEVPLFERGAYGAAMVAAEAARGLGGEEEEGEGGVGGGGVGGGGGALGRRQEGGSDASAASLVALAAADGALATVAPVRA
jgi:hypothetical protein